MAIAAITLKSTARFPVGTSVSAYPRSAWTGASTDVPRGAPAGSPAETATVAADGTLTFSTLTAGTRYYAYAQVGGEDRIVAFLPQAPATAAGTISPTTWDGTKAYSANDLVKYAAGLYRCKADKTGPTYTPGTIKGKTAKGKLSSGVKQSTTFDANTTSPSGYGYKGEAFEFSVGAAGTVTVTIDAPGLSGQGSWVQYEVFDSGGTLVGTTHTGVDNSFTATLAGAGTYYVLVTQNTSAGFPQTVGYTVTNGTATLQPLSNGTPAVDTSTWELLVQGV